MSRGLGKLQRAILEVLADHPADYAEVYDLRAIKWTLAYRSALVMTSFTSVRTEADLIPWPRPRRGATAVEESSGALDAWVTSPDRRR
jgi:hypothetical protein